MDAVLAIPELLEVMLLHLDMVTLLVSALRVCRVWHGVVSNSHALQQALHFRPVPGESWGSWLGDGYPGGWDPMGGGGGGGGRAGPVLNPLLADKFGSCFFDLGPTYGVFRRAESFYTMPWTAGHHTTLHLDGGPYRDPIFKIGLPAPTDAQAARDGAERDRRRFTRRGASWRRMLVSQPPPPHFGFLWFETEDPLAGPQTATTAVVRPDTDQGLRMGALYDLVQHHASHHALYSLWFRVLWGRLRPPHKTTLHRDHCERLLARAGVLVDLLHLDDVYHCQPRDPDDVAAFDAAFRSDEARPLDIEEPAKETSDVSNSAGEELGLVWHSSTKEPAPD